MKLRLLALATMPLALGLSLGLAPADQNAHSNEGATSQPSSRPARPPVGIANPPSLERAMKTMNNLIKTISAQVDDKAQDASTLVAVNNLQVFTVLAKAGAPDDVGELTGDAKAKAITDYHERMNGLIRAELKLEEAILHDNRRAAHEALAQLADQRKDGHEAYGVDDKHH